MEKLDDIISNNIFIFSSNAKKTYSEFVDMVKLLKPIIIIHLSDEWGTKEEYQGLHKYTKLVLRQYYHVHYYQKPNIKYIPLAYMNGMLENNYINLKLKLPVNRKYKWSFFGALKKDRIEMIKSFKKITPYLIGRINKVEMRDLYRNSIFVPKLFCYS